MQAPRGIGAAGGACHRGGEALPSGWRKVTAETVHTDALAEAGQQMDVSKGRAVVAVKRVAARIGLKAADVLLLDTLAAFTKAQDWAAGRRPIVWASNAYLMGQTGFSLSTLKRHARRLCEAGIIAFHDSPNGKRWGHRDADGVIVEAYGFDLSPMAARAHALEALAEEIAAERQLCQQLSRQITIARRMIRARLEAALTGAVAGPWVRLQRRFESLLQALPRGVQPAEALETILKRFRGLLERVEAAFDRAGQGAHVPEKTPNMNPREVNSDPHILTTTQPLSVSCKRSETEHAAEAPPRKETPRAVALDVPTVMQACPEFATWVRDLGGYVRHWGDVHRMAGQLRPMIGVSDQAWNAAQAGLGHQAAAAALALVFDKHARGEVTSPGAYLRGMVEKGRAGELHLERSFYGRLSGQAA